MKNKLEIVDFIKNNPDWETKLQEKPYCITISRDRMFGLNLIMFKYNQIDSDFNVELVRECRGIILNEDTLEPISVPFFKFGNVGEGWVKDIDWKTASVQEKIDGSLIKVVRIGNNLLISTNGTIDAYKAPLQEQIGCYYKNFGVLFESAIKNQFYDKIDWDSFPVPLMDKEIRTACMDLFKDNILEGKTYMFELVSPFNRVVVPYKDTKAYFIGIRDNNTLKEEFFANHELSKIFDCPKIFNLKTLDECIAATKELPWNEEGYVAMDSEFNRVKIKSPSYVSVHHLKGEGGTISYRRAIEIVRSNEIEEICSYFEEFRKSLDDCKDRFWKLVKETEDEWDDFTKISESFPSRKEKAMYIQKNFKIPGIAFGMMDGKISSVKDFFMNVPTDKILKYLGFKTNN